MNLEIIKKYKINFQNKLVDREIDKMPYTNLFSLTALLYECGLTKIETSLLPEINDVLNDLNSGIENGTNTVYITIYKDNVIFFEDQNKEFSIPTIEFKQIIEGWRDFLLSPPLDRTII